MAKAAETVWLASDEDREGEAISWHLYNALKLDDKKANVCFSRNYKVCYLECY